MEEESNTGFHQYRMAKLKYSVSVMKIPPTGEGQLTLKKIATGKEKPYLAGRQGFEPR